MQCNQPFCPGYPVPMCGPCMPAPTYPYNPTNTAPLYNRSFPEVVGEGDVTSMTMPDGGTQLYFVPASKSCPSPPMYNSGFGNCYNPYCNPNQGIWFIRSICNNQYLQPPFQQQQQNQLSWGGNPQLSLPISRSIYAFSSKCNLKFHNDCSTSTSDIHYFFPRLRTCNVVPKACASVQVQMEAPNTACQCSAAECKNTRNDKSTGSSLPCSSLSHASACECAQTNRRNRKERRHNKHKRTSDSRSSMSIDSIQSKPKSKNKRKKGKNTKRKHGRCDCHQSETKRKHGRCERYHSGTETTGGSQSYMSVDESTCTESSYSRKEKTKKPKRGGHSYSDSDRTATDFRSFMSVDKQDSCTNTEIMNDCCDICEECYLEMQQANRNETKPEDKPKSRDKIKKHKKEKNRKEKGKTVQDKKEERKSEGIKIKDNSATDKAKADVECRCAQNEGRKDKDKTSKSKLKMDKKNKQKNHDESKDLLSKESDTFRLKDPKTEETSKDKTKKKEKKKENKGKKNENKKKSKTDKTVDSSTCCSSTSVESKPDRKKYGTDTSDSDLCECCLKASRSEKGTCGDSEVDPCGCYPKSNKQDPPVVNSGPEHCCNGPDRTQLAIPTPIKLWFTRTPLSEKQTPLPPLRILSTTYCASDSMCSCCSDLTSLISNSKRLNRSV